MGTLRRTCATVARRGPLPKLLWANLLLLLVVVIKNIPISVTLLRIRWKNTLHRQNDRRVSGGNVKIRCTSVQRAKSIPVIVEARKCSQRLAENMSREQRRWGPTVAVACPKDDRNTGHHRTAYTARSVSAVIRRQYITTISAWR